MAMIWSALVGPGRRQSLLEETMCCLKVGEEKLIPDFTYLDRMLVFSLIQIYQKGTVYLEDTELVSHPSLEKDM